LSLGAFRNQPFRLFLPLGAASAVLGVGPWLLFWLGLESRWLGREHALIQFQGFLPCFAAGFLFTMLPRRTGTAPPGPVPLLLAAVGFPAAAVAGLLDAWLVAHAAYLLGLCGLGGYALAAPWRPEGRRTPNAFVLLPLALVQGAAGALLLAAVDLGRAGRKAELLGRLLIEEGVFLTLFLGLGVFLFPVFAGLQAPPDSTSTVGSRCTRIAYLAAGLLLIASFVAQVAVGDVVSPRVGVRVGYGVRFAIALAFALGPWQLLRRPAKRGTARTFTRVAAAMIPLALGALTAFPDQRLPFLHLLLVGGFSLGALSIGAHVSFAHCGRPDLRDGTSRWLRAAALLVLLAALTRASADSLPDSFVAHLGSASLVWLLGLLCWLVPLVPLWWRGPAEGAG
jgi:uncharacterized protein involved in response to NO